MKIILYILFFIMGACIGSFLNLAIYRIPLKKNIINERSFCPKCNHKLNALDLIPILSYIFLKGKCRYCKNKIKIQYLLTELISGVVVFIIYYSMNFRIFIFEKEKTIEFALQIFAYTIIAIISGIDKNNRTINKRVLSWGVIFELGFIIYECINMNISLFKYSILLGLLILLFVFQKYIRKEKKSSYLIEIIMFSLYINMIIDPILFGLIVLITILISIWNIVIFKVFSSANFKSIDEKQENHRVPVGFYMGISTIIVMIIQNYSLYRVGL